MAVSESEFNQLKDKVQMLIEALINKDELSILALQNGWDSNKVVQIYDIMEKFSTQEKTSYSFQSVDKCFSKEMGLNSKDVRSILYIFYHKRKFLSVIKRYLESNYDNFKNLPAEFNEAFAQLVNDASI